MISYLRSAYLKSALIETVGVPAVPGISMPCSFVMYLLLFVTGPYYEAYQNVQASAIENANKLTDSMRVKRMAARAEDVVIVMDGSGSSNTCEFEKGKKALVRLIGHLMKPSFDTKYAAVTFSDSASVNFKFLPSSSAANEIMKIPHPGGWTNTQAGLAEAKKLFDDPSSGRRDYSKKVVFLITDGQSNVETHLTIPNAKALKDSGVDIYVAVVGAFIPGIDELVKVVSYPPNQHIFRVTKLRDGSYDIVRLLLQRISPNKWQIMPGQYDPQ